MSNFIVIEKDSLNKSTVNAAKITLTEASIVHTKMHRDDVAEFLRDGNNLVLKLKNGEVIVLENFFVVDAEGVTSDLVFEEDGCVLYWFDGVSGFKGIPGLEALLPAVEGSKLIGLLPWLVGGAVVGGVIAATDDDKTKEPSFTPEPTAPTAPTVEVNGPIVPAEDETTPITGKIKVPAGTVPETVTVKVGGGEPIEVPVANITGPDENGDYSFTVDVPTEALVPGTPVTAEATVKDPETGKVSEPGESDPVVIEAAPEVPEVDDAQAIVVKVSESAGSMTSYPGLSGVTIDPSTGKIQTSGSIGLTDVSDILMSTSGNPQGVLGKSEIFVVNFDDIKNQGSDPNSFGDMKLNSITGNRGDSQPDWIYVEDVSDAWKVQNTNKVNNPTNGYNNFDNFVLEGSYVDDNGVVTPLSFNSNGVQGVIFSDGTVFTYDKDGNPAFNKSYEVDLSAKLNLGESSKNNLTSIEFSSEFLNSYTTEIVHNQWWTETKTFKPTVTVNGMVITADSNGVYTIEFDPTKAEVSYKLNVTWGRDAIQAFEDANAGKSFVDLLGDSLSDTLIANTVVDISPASMMLMSLDDYADTAGTDENSIFKVLDQEYSSTTENVIEVSGFTVGDSSDLIDISSLLSDDATEANLAEFVTVEYDEETDSAVISIDRDGNESTYELTNLVVLPNQSKAFDLDDLVQNNQIIIG